MPRRDYPASAAAPGYNTEGDTSAPNPKFAHAPRQNVVANFGFGALATIDLLVAL